MLHIPPWQFNNVSDNCAGTPSSSTPGTNFTAGANSADGSAVSVLSALAHDVHFLMVGLGGLQGSASDSSCLVDVLIDLAGGTSWSSFIDDLGCGGVPVPTTGGFNVAAFYSFPIWIPAGASLGVQARTAHTSNITTGRVMMYAYGNPNRPQMWWCGQKVESLGINAGTSKGTTVTPGTGGSWGSWTTIGTAGGRYGSAQLGIVGIDSNQSNQNWQLEIGAGSQRLPGTHQMPVFATNTEQIGWCRSLPDWCDVPAGTTMQARAKTSINEDISLAIYGVY